MKIKEQKQKYFKDTILKPATYEYVETGKVEVVSVKDADGNKKEIEKPIIEQKFIQPVVKTEEIELSEFVVEDPRTGEEHVFMCKKTAKKFISEFK